jgi:hypothetical protein
MCLVRVYRQDSGGTVIEVLTDPYVEQGTSRERWRGSQPAEALAVVDAFLRQCAFPNGVARKPATS